MEFLSYFKAKVIKLLKKHILVQLLIFFQLFNIQEDYYFFFATLSPKSNSEITAFSLGDFILNAPAVFILTLIENGQTNLKKKKKKRHLWNLKLGL